MAFWEIPLEAASVLKPDSQELKLPVPQARGGKRRCRGQHQRAADEQGFTQPTKGFGDHQGKSDSRNLYRAAQNVSVNRGQNMAVP